MCIAIGVCGGVAIIVLITCAVLRKRKTRSVHEHFVCVSANVSLACLVHRCLLCRLLEVNLHIRPPELVWQLVTAYITGLAVLKNFLNLASNVLKMFLTLSSLGFLSIHNLGGRRTCPSPHHDYHHRNLFIINRRSLLEKIGTRILEGGSIGPLPPSTFDTIRLIDLKFGTYSKLHLYSQLSEITWCLIGFHGNNSQINDVTGGRHLGFSNFQILFKFSLLYLRLTGKQHLAVEINEIGRIRCEVVSI